MFSDLTESRVARESQENTGDPWRRFRPERDTTSYIVRYDSSLRFENRKQLNGHVRVASVPSTAYDDVVQLSREVASAQIQIIIGRQTSARRKSLKRMRGSRKWRCCRTTAATLYVQGLAFISMLSSSRAWIGTTIPLAAKAAAPRVEARSSAVHDLSLNDEVADCIPRRTEHFRGALSMSVSELSQHLGGHGRARLAWDCYSIGVDPALYFRGEESLDTCSDVVKLLPGSRRKQRMGAHALQMLAGLYADYTGGGGASGCDSGAPRVDGGVAMVTHISQSSDNTTKVLLKFYDGTAVEMVIIPWNGVRSTLCISSQVGCRQGRAFRDQQSIWRGATIRCAVSHQYFCILLIRYIVGCTFCATGKMGKVRSLTTDEILAQMFFARKICRIYDNLPPVTNVGELYFCESRKHFLLSLF